MDISSIEIKNVELSMNEYKMDDDIISAVKNKYQKKCFKNLYIHEITGVVVSPIKSFGYEGHNKVVINICANVIKLQRDQIICAKIMNNNDFLLLENDYSIIIFPEGMINKKDYRTVPVQVENFTYNNFADKVIVNGTLPTKYTPNVVYYKIIDDGEVAYTDEVKTYKQLLKQNIDGRYKKIIYSDVGANSDAKMAQVDDVKVGECVSFGQNPLKPEIGIVECENYVEISRTSLIYMVYNVVNTHIKNLILLETEFAGNSKLMLAIK